MRARPRCSTLPPLLLLALWASAIDARQVRPAAPRAGAPAGDSAARVANSRWAHAPAVEWTQKLLSVDAAAAADDDAPARKRRAEPSAVGRGRSAKREQKYVELKRYAETHLRVLKAELDEEREQAREQLHGWGRERLAREGAAVFELSATSKDKLYSDRIVRLDLRGLPLPFHKFASGDLVSVSPTDSDGPLPLPDGGEQAAGIDGVVLSRSPKFVDVCIRPRDAAEAAVAQALAAQGGRWRLDSAISAVPYDRMALALQQFTQPGGGGGETASDELRDFVVGLGAQPPPVAAQLQPSRAQLLAACERAGLDESQRQAVRSTFNRQLSLVQGPPGTGKTRTACAIALATALAAAAPPGAGRGARSGRSLLVAPSNVAVDGLLQGCLELGLRCVRLGRPAFARAELRAHTLDALVPLPEGGLATGDGGLAHAAQMRRRWGALQGAQVVLATAVGAGELLTGAMASAPPVAGAPPLPPLGFELCLLDEAAQCLEAAAVLALVASGRAGRVVLVGDQCQLGPTLLAPHHAQLAEETPSLFARLVARGFAPQLLATQYRCPPALCAFSSRRFYQGRVRSACSPEERPRPPLVGGAVRWAGELPLLFVDTARALRSGGHHERRRQADTLGSAEAAAALDEERGGRGQAREPAEAASPRPRSRAPSGSTSFCNPCEARAVAALVRALLAGGLRPRDIGVVTPYAAQVRAITDELGELAQARGSEEQVEVSSVDGFQGREKEAIVVSAVRSNAQRSTGFLKDWRRLNVSVTRARRALIVVGDSRTLQADPHWHAFVEHARELGGYTELRPAGGGEGGEGADPSTN